MSHECLYWCAILARLHCEHGMGNWRLSIGKTFTRHSFVLVWVNVQCSSCCWCHDKARGCSRNTFQHAAITNLSGRDDKSAGSVRHVGLQYRVHHKIPALRLPHDCSIPAFSWAHFKQALAAFRTGRAPVWYHHSLLLEAFMTSARR